MQPLTGRRVTVRIGDQSSRVEAYLAAGVTVGDVVLTGLAIGTGDGVAVGVGWGDGVLTGVLTGLGELAGVGRDDAGV